MARRVHPRTVTTGRARAFRTRTRYRAEARGALLTDQTDRFGPPRRPNGASWRRFPEAWSGAGDGPPRTPSITNGRRWCACRATRQRACSSLPADLEGDERRLLLGALRVAGAGQDHVTVDRHRRVTPGWQLVVPDGGAGVLVQRPDGPVERRGEDQVVGHRRGSVRSVLELVLPLDLAGVLVDRDHHARSGQRVADVEHGLAGQLDR